MEYEMELIRKVYVNGEGVCMEIGPSPDFPGNVCLRNPFGAADSVEHFGSIRLDMPAKFMRLIGHALIDAADDAEASPPGIFNSK